MADRARGARRAAWLAVGLGLGLPAGTARGAPRPAAGEPAPIGLVGGWTDDERAAIESAALAVPPAVRARAPAAVLRDARACDGEGWPDDDALVDRQGRVHLCARPGATPTPAELARQVVTALAFGFDRSARWSDDPGWRRLNRWRSELGSGFQPRAANRAPAGFASPRGRRSPRWDLATFLAALWLDPPGDAGTGCRLLSQTVFVHRQLGDPTPRDCPAFERWAELDRLADVEVVLAAPSTAMIGSLFGHLFLRLVYRDDAGQTPPHLSRTVAFLADNDLPFEDDPGYALKGILGLYDASLHERDFLDVYREYVVVEGRDLRRWRLDLDAGERRALAERLWTALHASRYSYYFFRRNCATLMVDLLDDVRPPGSELPAAGLLAAPPASTLEPWAEARGADGAPLLQFVPEPILSFDHRARLAARDRLAVEARIERALAPESAAAAAAAFADGHATDPAVRAAAYARLAAILAADRRAAPADLSAWLRDGAAIETHLSAIANLKATALADRLRRQRLRAVADETAAGLRSEAADFDAVAAAPAAPDARAPGTAAPGAATPGAATPGAAAPGTAMPGNATPSNAMPGSGRRARLLTAVDLVQSSAAEARIDGYRALLGLTEDPRARPEVVSRIRLLAVLQSEARYDVARMKAVPGLRGALLFPEADAAIDRQPYLAGRADLIRVPEATQVSPPLRALQQTKQALYSARSLAGQPPPEAPDGPAAVAAARRDYDASLDRSGLDQAAVLAGAALGAGPPAAGLVLGGALYDERLGDHRRFGFPSDTALVVGRSAALLTDAGGTPALAAYQARVFGYRSLRAPLPESGTGRAGLGWETYGDLAGSRARDLGAETTVGWGLLVPIADGGELTNHLLGSAGLAYEGYFPSSAAVGAGHPQAAGLPLALELRAGVGPEPRYRSAFAARAWAAPLGVSAGTARRLAFETGATIEAHLALGGGTERRRDPAVLLRAEILRTTVTFRGASAATEALVGLGLELR